MITGGAGFVGSHLSDYFCARGHKVAVVDNLSTGSAANLNRSLSFYNNDVNDDELEAIIAKERPEHIYHLAAQINVAHSRQQPRFDADNNIIGTINILNHAVKHKSSKIIFASSAAVYGNPLYLPLDEKHPATPVSFYGLSKYTAECYIKMFNHQFGLPYTILRFANVYGPRQQANGEGGVIAEYIARHCRGDKLVVHGDGEQTRDFIYISDVVAACYQALGRGENQTFNISGGQAVSINELGRAIKGSEKDFRPLYIPRREGDILHSRLDNQRAARGLHWRPQIDLYSGLKKTLEFKA